MHLGKHRCSKARRREDNQDALLAALVTFCVCLLALLFFPVVADQLPDLARTAIVYGAVLVGVAAVFEFIRRKRH